MESTSTTQDLTRRMLLELGFSPRHTGYRALCLAIPSYARNSSQSITKELYPSIKRQYGYDQTSAVERHIRYTISDAWEHGNPEEWKRYFPRNRKAPSNLVFIATMAEYLK